MAVFAATDLEVTIGGTDFSASLAAVTLDISREQLETTAFGDAARTFIAGLQEGSVTLSFHQDFAASAVDETLHAALGTELAFVVKPTSAAVGTGNPSYSFSALVTQVLHFPVTWVISLSKIDFSDLRPSYPRHKLVSAKV